MGVGSRYYQPPSPAGGKIGSILQFHLRIFYSCKYMQGMRNLFNVIFDFLNVFSISKMKIKKNIVLSK